MGDCIMLRRRVAAAVDNDKLGLKNSLRFTSASPFTISVTSPAWDGEMQYYNGKTDGWKTWDGGEISSGEYESDQYIFIRGNGNTIVSSRNHSWTLTGTSIECNGNIENLLNYTSVPKGIHPKMQSNCFSYMFYNCRKLTKAPGLPATQLTDSCYSYMFSGCTSLTKAPTIRATKLAARCCFRMFSGCTALTSVPALHATKLANLCYGYMFYGCTKIKVYTTVTSQSYRIPYSGTGTTATNALQNMFTNTGGTFTGTPEINTTYYLDESITIV